MRRGLEGSYTIEAALVMAVVFLTIATLIKAAYRIHDETLGAMVLQETVEIVRHGEEISIEDEIHKSHAKAGLTLFWPDYKIQVKNAMNYYTGIGKGGKWGLEIGMKRYNPEEFIRLLSLAEEEDGN